MFSRCRIDPGLNWLDQIETLNRESRDGDCGIDWPKYLGPIDLGLIMKQTFDCLAPL